MSRPVEVAVLGAAGTIAGAIVRDLAEYEEVGGLRLLDLDAARAAEAAERHGAGKARAEAVDARQPGALAAALEGCEVLVNSASYRINLEAMDAAVAAGCHYVDLGGLYWMTAQQLERGEQFLRADRLALLGMGSSPGKTNVMAVAAARALGGDRLDEAHVSAAGRDPAPAREGVLRLPYALATLLDELRMNPIVVAGGRAVEIEPMSSGGEVGFPEPIGPSPTLHTLHSELLTFPTSFACREASFRLSLAPALERKLTELSRAGEAEVQAAAATVAPPSDQTVSAHVVQARVGDRRATVSALTVPAADWGLGGGVVSTAAPAAAAVRLLARGRIDARGALPPELCVDPDDLFVELERRGCTFSIELDGAPPRPLSDLPLSPA